MLFIGMNLLMDKSKHFHYDAGETHALVNVTMKAQKTITNTDTPTMQTGVAHECNSCSQHYRVFSSTWVIIFLGEL